MNNKKKLKINLPEIYTYTVLGAIFSIAKNKDMPFFYNEFVQIMYHDEWKMFVFEAHQNLLENCPFIKTENYAFSNLSNKEIINNLIILLENNFYIYIFLDWKYIVPDMVKSNLAHTTLISGYDSEKHIFLVSDNYDEGRFVTIEIDMDVVVNAFKSAWYSSVGNQHDNDGSSSFDYLKNIIAFKYRDEVSVSFNKNILISNIKSYYNSYGNRLFNNRPLALYGYDSYKIIKDALNKESFRHFQVKNFHLLYEHKIIMVKRLQYLSKYGYINKSDGYISQAEEIMQNFLIIRNLYLKFMMAPVDKKDTNRNKILELIDISLEKEKRMLGNLLIDLQ